MRKTNAASLPDLMKLARELGVKYIACSTSCSVLGLTGENLMGEVDEFAGAATYLSEAKEAKINLFI
jgi:peroxiredoxin family protein